MKILLLFALIIAAGCSRPDYHANIQKITDARLAEKTSLVENLPAASARFPSIEYAHWANGVDLNGCPDDFKAAWTDYAISWQSVSFTNRANPVVISPGAANTMKADSDNGMEDLKAGSPTTDSVGLAWQSVVKVAASYGVTTQ